MVRNHQNNGSQFRSTHPGDTCMRNKMMRNKIMRNKIMRNKIMRNKIIDK